MDEMKLISKFARGVFSKILNKCVSKRGYNMDISIDEVTATIIDGKVRAKVAAYVEMPTEEFERLVLKKVM